MPIKILETEMSPSEETSLALLTTGLRNVTAQDKQQLGKY
jgi:hypothetical protein